MPRQLPRRRSGRRKFVLMGIVALAGARRRRLWRLLLSGRPLLSSRPTTPMSAPTTPCWARGCPAMSPRSCPATIRWFAPATSSSGSTTATTGSRSTRRAPRSRPSRPPSTASAVRSPRWKARSSRRRAQLVSAEAGLKRAGLDYDRQQALEHQGICLARHLRAVRSRRATRAWRP